MFKQAFAATCLALSLCLPARAAIIDNGSYTTDTTSGLDWLDVTSSVNLSYDDVSAQFGSGGDFEGWRYATGDEFNALVSHYTGTTVSNYGFVNQETDKIDGLVILLGSTLDTYWLQNFGLTYDAYYSYAEGYAADFTYGLLADLDPVIADPYLALIYDADARDPIGISTIDRTTAHYAPEGKGTRIALQGSYLVRNTVPEPSVLALLAIGLSGIGMSWKRSLKSMESDTIDIQKPL